MGFFRSTPHRSKSSYDDEEPLQNHHEVLELEPTTSTPMRPTSSSSSDASYDETTNNISNNNSASKQRQRQKRRKRYRQQGGYQRLGGQIANAWHSVTALPSSDPPPQDNHTGHITEDDEAMHYPENDINNRFKRSLYLLLEEPSSSHAAFWTNVVVSFLIVSSAVMTTIETIPAFRSAESNRVW